MSKAFRLFFRPARGIHVFFFFLCIAISFKLSAQTVTNKEGDKLNGVSVNVTGSKQGTVTDPDGKYSLTVPALAPNPYSSVDPAVKGGFVHRLVYPAREQSVNTVNYNAAVARMGAYNLATRLFWDK